ncbi:uncharacterized protein LOC117652080 [Thrips palmi]|uniref:Uncharacterized protein LOC117652080 n=1 Tax=Thrips palmi TaxID=161013 RepID=A0A6P9A5X2_THRPL|nr:uncharacterized protein LOC117652080 [Thrips palmi]
MCLSQHPHSALASPPLVRDAEDAKAFTSTLDAMARRPSWTLRGVFKQPSSTNRPGLPRRFHTKINLNEYWNVLEKVVKVEVSWPRTKENVKPDADDAMDVDNAVNENLANERAEQSKMDVVKDEPTEPEVIAAPSTVKVPEDAAAPPAKRAKGRRRSTPPSPAPLCGSENASPCGIPSPCRRVPLGALNGFASRGHIRKSLSPLSTFADNLARRLARQH